MLLERIVARVFPPDSRLLDTSAGEAARFHLLSGTAGPRWLLPEDARHGLAFIGDWRPYGVRSHATWRVIRLAYRTGLLRLLPGVRTVAITLPDGASWGHLGWRAGENPVPVVHIGTPSREQKLVVGLVKEASGRSEAVAKLAFTPAAQVRIAHEIRMLSALARERPGLAPEVLHEDPEQGLVTLSPLRGRPSGRRLGDAHRRLLLGLRLAEERVCPAVLVETLRARLGDIEGNDGARAVVETLATLARGQDLPAFWVHGDFAPWNLRLQADGAIAAFDWEEGERGGPPLQDLVHFYYNQTQLLEGRSGLEALRERTTVLHGFLDDLGIARGRLDELVRWYLVRAWLRRRELGDAAYAQALLRDLRALGPGA